MRRLRRSCEPGTGAPGATAEPGPPALEAKPPREGAGPRAMEPVREACAEAVIFQGI